MGLAVLIPPLQLHATRPWLTRDEFACVINAQAVLACAQAEAARLVEQAQLQAQQLKDAAMAQGRREAQAELARELASVSMGASRVLSQLHTVIARMVARTFSGALDEMAADKLYQLALRRAARAVREEPFITMRVPPSRQDAARSALHRLSTELGWDGHIDVQADAALADHACVLESAAGQVACGMDIVLDAVVAAVQREVAVLAPASAAGGQHAEMQGEIQDQMQGDADAAAA